MSREKSYGITPDNWNDYELIDCGNLLKFERFGSYSLIRPEPQALWKPAQPIQEWRQKANAEYTQLGSHKGEWQQYRQVPESWGVKFPLTKNQNLLFNLKFTAFKHVGIFPEQADNWKFIYNNCQRIGSRCKVLNLFAYTGGASLAAKAAGADVVHVDSVKQVVNWARKNMDSSGLKDIRWVVEDALKFVQRERKRGHLYNGIILDPPAYGIGTKGERWKLEDSIQELLQNVAGILPKQDAFVVLNTYSLGLSPLIIDNLMRSSFKRNSSIECSELYLQSTSKYKLPLGVIGRLIQ
jgi:23S rRNA (cytosine1962-C5)-methyltransferase